MRKRPTLARSAHEENGSDAASSAALRRRLAETGDALLYLIDVGVDDPQNTMLGVPRLPAESLPASSELVLEVDVACTSPPSTLSKTETSSHPDKLGGGGKRERGHTIWL